MIEQSNIFQLIDNHEKAEYSYVDEGVRILELAQKAGNPFDRQVLSEKRRLLNRVVSGATWKQGVFEIQFRQPSDMLIDAIALVEAKQPRYKFELRKVYKRKLKRDVASLF